MQHFKHGATLAVVWQLLLACARRCGLPGRERMVCPTLNPLLPCVGRVRTDGVPPEHLVKPAPRHRWYVKNSEFRPIVLEAEAVLGSPHCLQVIIRARRRSAGDQEPAKADVAPHASLDEQEKRSHSSPVLGCTVTTREHVTQQDVPAAFGVVELATRSLIVAVIGEDPCLLIEGIRPVWILAA